MKKYVFFFTLHIFSLVVWAVWALPQMGESGTFPDEASWLAAQIVLPVFISVLLARHYRPGLWIALAWGLIILLSGAGLLGWALMGPATPFVVHFVALLLLMDGLGIFSSALKDLKWIHERNRYALED